ncbi:hypothetical protein NL676_035659 [Syzygium grande]|nr:hypothetical protein NL676_035659 [Syzygium grande]
MSASPTLKLPLIDLSKLDGSKPGTGRWDSLRCQVRRALEEFGCFEALYDKMTLELHNDLFQELEELLELPNDVKRRFIVPEKQFDGYHTNPPHAPPYEVFGMDYGPNSDKYVDLLARSVKYSFRLMGYAPPGNDESKMPDTTCHRDVNFVTILHQNHVNGLEMETKDGRWIEVAPSSACSFIVLTGESFYGWSNGRLHSPRHRVRVSGHERRYSIGLFSSDQGTVQCPDELVDDQHPFLFKPFDVAGLSRIYNTKEGKNGASAMDTFYRI